MAARRDRVLLFRPLTMESLHPEVNWKTGSDARTLSAPGDISFTVPPSWADMVDEDGHKVFGERSTLVVVERPNRTIRNVGLVDDLTLTADALNVSCGGLSMLPGQSGPWEGHQGQYLRMDPVTLFRQIIQQVQTYDNANVGLRVVGDTASGSTVGTVGSQRWYEARSAVNRYAGNLGRWEAKQLDAERRIAHTVEQLFRASGVKRVGTVSYTENEPDDPGYQHVIWIKESTGTPFAWRDTRWVAQDQARYWANQWRHANTEKDEASDNVSRLQYMIEPHQEVLDEMEHDQEEQYSLFFWQNHDLNSVVEDLLGLGPFEFREEASWDGDDLDLKLRVGAPQVGVRREELHLELGFNVQEQPEIAAQGDAYTGVALFGAGEGSEVLSAQRDWDPDHMVRRILTETDKDAHNKALTRAAADRLAKEVRSGMRAGFTDLVIHHGKACPEGSFNVGDQIPVTGVLPDGSKTTQWARVLDASNEWGSNKTNVEVELV